MLWPGTKGGDATFSPCTCTDVSKLLQCYNTKRDSAEQTNHNDWWSTQKIWLVSEPIICIPDQKMKLWMVVWRRRRRRRGNDGCSHNIPPALPFFPLIYELKAKHPSSDDPRNGDHCRNQRALPLAQWWMSRWKKERERGYGRSKEILGKIESWRNHRKSKGENLRWKNEETKN